MSEFKGTKGVFRFESGLGHAIIYDDCDIDVLDESDNTKETVKYNAQLMINAKQMLEMLNDFVKTANESGLLNVEYYKNKFEQLIQQATTI